MITQSQIKAICFDKDGTLFDYRATWDVWAGNLLAEISGGDSETLEALAKAIAFDLKSGQIQPTSIAIAGTNREIAEVLAGPSQRSASELEQIIVARAATAPLQPACDLPALLEMLKGSGLKLGVMTNDTYRVAEAHLTQAGILDRFDFVAGADSGYGFKPDPGPLLAFCDQVGVDPAYAVMVGDSTHDLQSGADAGMITVGVQTGVARLPELAPHADAVLNDIGELPEWLGIV